MLKHVQTLETLRSISIHNIGAVQEVFPEVKNHHVESLTLRQMSMSYELPEKKYIALFPNLKKLVMYPDTWISNIVIEQINSMDSLKELVIVDPGDRGSHDLQGRREGVKGVTVSRGPDLKMGPKNHENKRKIE
jgi:hypothetical protein